MGHRGWRVAHHGGGRGDDGHRRQPLLLVHEGHHRQQQTGEKKIWRRSHLVGTTVLKTRNPRSCWSSSKRAVVPCVVLAFHLRGSFFDAVASPVYAVGCVLRVTTVSLHTASTFFHVALSLLPVLPQRCTRKSAENWFKLGRRGQI